MDFSLADSRPASLPLVLVEVDVIRVEAAVAHNRRQLTQRIRDAGRVRVLRNVGQVVRANHPTAVRIG